MRFLIMSICALALPAVTLADTSAPEYDVDLVTATSGFDGETCWVHPRAGAIPGNPSTVVMTTQKLLLSGSDIFYELNSLRTTDLGKTWTAPAPQEHFKRRVEADGREVVVCDFTPKWHAATGTLLGTGHLARYENNRLVRDHRRGISYAAYDQENHAWRPWREVAVPDPEKFYNAGAGCSQRVDLPNGDILLPVYFKSTVDEPYSATVFHCTFDGETLAYAGHGSEHFIPVQRGFAEPSLAQSGGQYFLTLRNDVAGYVTSSTDGLHFHTPVKWRFDDGKELGSYNTQQHWVTHGDDLYLVYTRRGAGNDHVFRHRAPLFIAQVDKEALRVIRATERILVPERGARLGNFAVTEVSANETWVTVAEWMQPEGVEKHGSDNSIYAARILWK
ncbi:MAG: exo-alpha-sialidase [Candidatus Hydrogenedentes bacterium]|nr:exo-alpha-sialidase [Candidatus Hydrogenedentota bacterium]